MKTFPKPVEYNTNYRITTSPFVKTLPVPGTTCQEVKIGVPMIVDYGISLAMSLKFETTTMVSRPTNHLPNFAGPVTTRTTAGMVSSPVLVSQIGEKIPKLLKQSSNTTTNMAQNYP